MKAFLLALFALTFAIPMAMEPEVAAVEVTPTEKADAHFGYDSDAEFCQGTKTYVITSTVTETGVVFVTSYIPSTVTLSSTITFTQSVPGPTVITTTSQLSTTTSSSTTTTTTTSVSLTTLTSTVIISATTSTTSTLILFKYAQA